ncbi:MAG TPA: hypothetical protein VM260_21405, partial [Pirellula sp.]|nr:hypothetical protein [Pirellula sp.]
GGETNPGLDRTNAREVAEGYIASAIQEDVTACASFARGTPAETKQITEISNNLNVKNLPLKWAYVDYATKPTKALAISVQTIVSGHVKGVNDKLATITEVAALALTKFSDRYERAKQNAKSELDKLRSHPDLIWRDGRPHDPASDKIAKCMESISEIDGRIKNIEAVMQQIVKGREANRPIEELLRMALNSINDNGFNKSFYGNDLNREMDIARNLRSQVEQIESDRVIPHRDILDQLRGQSLGDSHPSVITARNRLDKYEQELARRKADLRKMEDAFEKENGTSRKDYLSVERRLQIAYGVLQTTLQKLIFEKSQFKAEADALKDKMKENQFLISNYAINLADFEAVKEIADQINEGLRKTILGQETVIESKQSSGHRYVSMVLSLTMIEERWYVSEVEFEAKDGAIGKLLKFLEDNPKAISITAPTTR